MIIKNRWSLLFTVLVSAVDYSRIENIPAALVIRRLFICKFAYSHWQKWSKMTLFQSKTVFLSAISRFAVQNDGTYLPRITRETLLFFSFYPHEPFFFFDKMTSFKHYFIGFGICRLKCLRNVTPQITRNACPQHQ